MRVRLANIVLAMMVGCYGGNCGMCASDDAEIEPECRGDPVARCEGLVIRTLGNVTKKGIGSPQGAYIEGYGLQAAVYEATFDTITEKPNGILTRVDIKICDKVEKAPQELVIDHCEPGSLGAYTCNVSSTDGTEFCGTTSKTNLGESDRNATRRRGVVIVRGYWDASGQWHPGTGNQVTVSCDSKQNEKRQHGWADGSIANCVRLGFYPGILRNSMDHDQFLACIRAMRADYCGDGASYTRHGTIIDLHELSMAGYKRRFQKWRECRDGRCFEASWSPRGAERFVRRRWAEKLELAPFPPGCVPAFTQEPGGTGWDRPSDGGVYVPTIATRTETHYCKSPRDAGVQSCTGVPSSDERCQDAGE